MRMKQEKNSEMNKLTYFYMENRFVCEHTVESSSSKPNCKDCPFHTIKSQ